MDAWGGPERVRRAKAIFAERWPDQLWSDYSSMPKRVEAFAAVDAEKETADADTP